MTSSRLYQIDNSSHLRAFDTATGKELWELALGTAQKAAPILADGKIYVGTDNGTFHIVRPHADRGEMLSEVELPNSVTQLLRLGRNARSRFSPVPPSRAVASSSSRVMPSMRSGSKQAKAVTGLAVDEPAPPSAWVRPRTFR